MRTLSKAGKMSVGSKVLIGVIIVVVLALLFMVFKPAAVEKTITPTGDVVITEALTADELCRSKQCAQNPTYTYSAVDAFARGTVLGGIANIKVNDIAPKATLANPTKCDNINYWLDNGSGTYSVKPTDVEKVVCGPVALEGLGYKNGSVTMTVVNRVGTVTLSDTTTGTEQNLTLAANGLANLVVSYQGTAKEPAMPFGGCFIVEVPNNISTVTPSGAGIDATKCRFVVGGYTISSVGHAAKYFDVPFGFDISGEGDYKEIGLQLKASGEKPAGAVLISMFPAAYYVTDTGDIVLGVEEDLNQVTTRTKSFEPDVDFFIV